MPPASIWNALVHELVEALQEQGLDSAHLESALVTPLEEAPVDFAPANSDLVSLPEVPEEEPDSEPVNYAFKLLPVQESKLYPDWEEMHNQRSCKGTPFQLCKWCSPKCILVKTH